MSDRNKENIILEAVANYGEKLKAFIKPKVKNHVERKIQEKPFL